MMGALVHAIGLHIELPEGVGLREFVAETFGETLPQVEADCRRFIDEWRPTATWVTEVQVNGETLTFAELVARVTRPTLG